MCISSLKSYMQELGFYFRLRFRRHFLGILNFKILKGKWYEWITTNQNQILILPLIQHQILILLLYLTLNLNLILTQCLWIWTFVFFWPYICILLNKLADVFFVNSQNRINSSASNTSIMHIFFWYIITQKACFYYTIKFSDFSF